MNLGVPGTGSGPRSPPAGLEAGLLPSQGLSVLKERKSLFWITAGILPPNNGKRILGVKACRD